jgi:hypothetical protein
MKNSNGGRNQCFGYGFDWVCWSESGILENTSIAVIFIRNRIRKIKIPQKNLNKKITLFADFYVLHGAWNSFYVGLEMLNFFKLLTMKIKSRLLFYFLHQSMVRLLDSLRYTQRYRSTANGWLPCLKFCVCQHLSSFFILSFRIGWLKHNYFFRTRLHPPESDIVWFQAVLRIRAIFGTDPDADRGGPKTYGSYGSGCGSGTLVFYIIL